LCLIRGRRRQSGRTADSEKRLVAARAQAFLRGEGVPHPALFRMKGAVRRFWTDEAMMTLVDSGMMRSEHPLDLVERLASHNDWAFDREAEDEIAIAVKGAWAEYSLGFSWLEDLEALHVACSFQLKPPESRRQELMRLISFVNEQLWFGHFDLWDDGQMIMFRHSLLLAGGMEPTQRQCEKLMQIAVETCEKYFQAFQFTVWAGKSARDSLEGAMFVTAGQA
jgi:hypothetical protein